MNRARLVLTLVVLGVLLFVVILGAGVVLAENSGSANNTTSTSFPPLVQKMVDKFNLNPSEVQKVLDEAREEKRQQMRAAFAERLDEAVKEGKITEKQKEAILKKWDEIQEEREKQRKEMQKWAEENGIDLEVLRELRGLHGWRGKGSCRGGLGPPPF